MKRITFRIAVAVLTFVVGVATASLWFLLRRSTEDKKSGPTQSVKTVDDDWPRAQAPKVRWVYIKEPLDFGEDFEDAITSAYVVIFYESGEWGRFAIHVKKDKGKLRILDVGTFLVEVGTWEEVNKGKIAITINDCKCSSESIPIDGGKGNKYPITEDWSTEESLGQKEKFLRNVYGKYRLIRRDEFTDEKIEELLSAPFQIKKYASRLWRDCLKEDRH